ncbi:MAG: aldehyde dehydrogenase family protein [Vampirovibrionales bacterium]
MNPTHTSLPKAEQHTLHTLVHPCFINGQWLPSHSTQRFETVNPSQPSQSLGGYPQCNETDVAMAVDAAQAAYPAWKATPAPKRADYLYTLANLLKQAKPWLAHELAEEVGKPLKEAQGDVQEAIDMALLMAGEGRRFHGKHTPCEHPHKLSFAKREPIGVCGLITPWNFPIAVPSWKLFPALVAGNTVVWKPSEYAPRMAQRMVELLELAKFPAGVVNLIYGDASTGSHLIEHPTVRMISFTGSSASGAKVASRCGELHKRVALELGGKNPCLVLPDADLDLACEGIVWGAFGTAGQRCTATSRLFVHETVHDALLGRLLKRTAELKRGLATTASTELGPVINAHALERLQKVIQRAVEEGATVACGGHPHPTLVNTLEPTILTGVEAHHTIATEEAFGPILAIRRYHTLEEAITEINRSAYGLSCAIYGQNQAELLRVMDVVEAGLVYINAPSIGAEVQMPFGGVKATGNGFREAGWTALDAFSEWKNVMIDYSGTLQKAQLTP